MTTEERLSPILAETQQFVLALEGTPALRRLEAATRRVREDTGARRLREAFGRAEEASRHGHRDETVREQQNEALREAQLAYQRHPAVIELFRAQMEVTLLLRSVNSAMSDILGLDVGQTVRSARGGF